MDDDQSLSMAGSGKKERASIRHKVFEPSELSIGSDRTRAHLINVSATGALVHSQACPTKGSQVELQIAGNWFLARIMWAAPPRLGLAFDGRLPDEVLAILLEG